MSVRGVLIRFWLRVCSLTLLIAAAVVLPAACGRQSTSTVPVSEVAVRVTAPASQIFALVRPGATPGEVLVARATERQPGGPETLVPVKIQPYKPVRLAPGVMIRITAPYYEGDLSDWISGALVSPEQFASMVRRAEARYGPLPNRARMFHVTLDAQGRLIRMQHIFSP
ncbi:hypothetical protein [Actinomadura alba]|uniref:Uncharacterized protein n=1 Tax=Actinomadura alba TaxID=406431 RepID=A0ABR7LSD6_9ACTN|nr:hypothetical protein [Actinomadura alba]MBC6467670.1 hypothetical protein [Actinomadura alba]